MKYGLAKILLAILVVTAIQSCIKEDRSDCNPGVLLKYDYSLNQENENLFGKEVGKVSAYVFDDNGLYYDCYSDAGSHLTNDYQMHLPLPAGSYSVIVWGGTMDSYQVGETSVERENPVLKNLTKGVTHMNDFMLMAKKAGQQVNDLVDLFHGKVDNIESVYIPKEVSTVQLTKNTNLVNVTIESAEIKENTEYNPFYQVYSTAANSHYRHDNSLGDFTKQTTYLPHNNVQEAGKLFTQTNVLRLMKGEPQKLTIKNHDGEVIYECDLVEMITQNTPYKTQEDLDRQDEYDIRINLNKDLIVSVTVNGWQVIEIEPIP